MDLEAELGFVSLDHSGQVFMSDAQLSDELRRGERESILSRATSVMNSQLEEVAGARLANLLLTDADGAPSFTAIVHTPVAIEPRQVERIERALGLELRSPARLRVRSVLTKEADRVSFLYEQTSERAQLPPTEAALRKRIQDVVTRRLGSIDGAVLKELRVEGRAGKRIVTATVEAPVLVRPEQVAEYEKDLRAYVDPSTVLEVLTMVSGTASASGWTRP